MVLSVVGNQELCGIFKVEVWYDSGGVQWYDSSSEAYWYSSQKYDITKCGMTAVVYSEAYWYSSQVARRRNAWVAAQCLRDRLSTARRYFQPDLHKPPTFPIRLASQSNSAFQWTPRHRRRRSRRRKSNDFKLDSFPLLSRIDGRERRRCCSAVHRDAATMRDVTHRL